LAPPEVAPGPFEPGPPGETADADGRVKGANEGRHRPQDIPAETQEDLWTATPWPVLPEVQPLTPGGEAVAWGGPGSSGPPVAALRDRLGRDQQEQKKKRTAWLRHGMTEI
jgi:hypothetical protein